MAKILVVDDSIFVYKAIQRVLEPQGFEFVGYAENGEVGIELFEKLKPDVVTLDITMPVMNGIDCAKAILNIDPDAKIIMMSALTESHNVDSVIELGIKHFLSKPLNKDELLNKATMILEE